MFVSELVKPTSAIVCHVSLRSGRKLMSFRYTVDIYHYLRWGGGTWCFACHLELLSVLALSTKDSFANCDPLATFFR